MLADECVCDDEYLRSHELWLRNKIFHEKVNDDYVFEPWITVRAVLEVPQKCKKDPKSGYIPIWGVNPEFIKDTAGGIGWRTVPVLKSKEDLQNLVATDHKVNEEETAQLVNQMEEEGKGGVDEFIKEIDWSSLDWSQTPPEEANQIQDYL